MAERTEAYRKMIDEIAAHVGKVINHDDSKTFGSMVLISTQFGKELTSGDVKGWASPAMREKFKTPDMLMMAFFSLVMVLLDKEKVNPEALHKLVMAGAIKTGAAPVIVIDDDGEVVFSTMIGGKDIPQA